MLKYNGAKKRPTLGADLGLCEGQSMGKRQHQCNATEMTTDSERLQPIRTMAEAFRTLRLDTKGINEIIPLGGLTEWTKVPVLKTGVPQGTGGSNPSPSAISYRTVNPKEAHGYVRAISKLMFTGALFSINQ